MSDQIVKSLAELEVKVPENHKHKSVPGSKHTQEVKQEGNDGQRHTEVTHVTTQPA